MVPPLGENHSRAQLGLRDGVRKERMVLGVEACAALDKGALVFGMHPDDRREQRFFYRSFAPRRSAQNRRLWPPLQVLSVGPRTELANVGCLLPTRALTAC